jgi:hypothetical protein
VEPILETLGIGDLDEHQAGRLTGGGSQLDTVIVLADDVPTRGGLPPSRERRRIMAIDNDFLETERHASTVGRSRGKLHVDCGHGAVH